MTNDADFEKWRDQAVRKICPKDSDYLESLACMSMANAARDYFKAEIENKELISRAYADAVRKLKAEIGGLKDKLAESEKHSKHHWDKLHEFGNANDAQAQAIEMLTEALEECRKASKVNEPYMDKWIIRNITGTALTKSRELMK